MSSILKALKKLEDETGQSDTHEISQAIDAKAVVRKGVQNPRGLGKILWGSLAMTVLIAGIWFLSNRNPLLPGKPVSEKAVLSAERAAPPMSGESVSGDIAAVEKKPETFPARHSVANADGKAEISKIQPEVEPVVIRKEAAPLKAEEKLQEFRDIVIKQSRTGPEPEKRKKEESFGKPDSVAGLPENSLRKKADVSSENIFKNIMTNSAKEKEVLPELPAPTDPVRPESADPPFPKPAMRPTERSSENTLVSAPERKTVREIPEKKSVVSVPVSGDNYDSVPEKTSGETGLEIQALVWSEDADGRMAVINGSIVRQTGMVADVTVSVIGSDFIVFRNKGGQWKQKFRLN